MHILNRPWRATLPRPFEATLPSSSGHVEFEIVDISEDLIDADVAVSAHARVETDVRQPHAGTFSQEKQAR